MLCPLQALAPSQYQIMQCHMRMVPQDRTSTDLFLETEPDSADDRVWRASTAWDPSSSASSEAKVSASGAAPTMAINVQARISCRLASGPLMHFLVNSVLQVQLIPRCALQAACLVIGISVNRCIKQGLTQSPSPSHLTTLMLQ